MPPIPSNIGSLGATPYVDAFTTGEILGFVVLIICTQIVITWIAVRSIKRRIICTAAVIEVDMIDSHEKIIKGINQIISDILPERM